MVDHCHVNLVVYVVWWVNHMAGRRMPSWMSGMFLFLMLMGWFLLVVMLLGQLLHCFAGWSLVERCSCCSPCHLCLHCLSTHVQSMSLVYNAGIKGVGRDASILYIATVNSLQGSSDWILVTSSFATPSGKQLLFVQGKNVVKTNGFSTSFTCALCTFVNIRLGAYTCYYTYRSLDMVYVKPILHIWLKSPQKITLIECCVRLFWATHIRMM